MARVRKASCNLHVLNNENEAHSWNSLIVAAQLELRRIENRETQLREAIEIFKRREQEGAPCIGSQKILEIQPATQN
jgi:hypothetical protein